MGEKRAYKSRKPGGGRKKLKPEYDAGKNLKEQMESAVELYNSEMSLQAIREELGLNPIKVADSIKELEKREDDLSGAGVTMLGNVDGKSMVEQMSPQFLEFVLDAYRSLKYRK